MDEKKIFNPPNPPNPSSDSQHGSSEKIPINLENAKIQGQVNKKEKKKRAKKSAKGLCRTISNTGNVASRWLCGDEGPPEQMQRSLARDSGFFFGGMNQFGPDSYIAIPQGEEGHILMTGGSGSGKSSMAKAALATWDGAICAADIKGELSECYERLSEKLLRAGIISRSYIIFDPTQEDGPAYDPFWWLLHDHEANLVSNIDEIALAIIPSLPDEKEPFWSDTERTILSAALFHYFKLGLSFSETVNKILEQDISSLCKELAESKDVCVKMRLGQIANADHTDSKILVGVDEGLRNKIMLFATDPYISHAFRGEREGAVCFNWDDLNQHNIFLRIPAYRVETWGRAINLMYTQLIRCLERRPEKYSAEGARNIQTLLLMDEFARFGKLEMITAAMSTLRSKNVNICLMVQSWAQLDKVYGKDERRILVDNAQYLVILQANDVETQKWFAERIGTKARYQSSMSEQLDRLMKGTGYSMQLSEARDWTVFPHKLSTLEDVLLLSPYGFCRLKKFRPSEEAWQRLLSSICRTHRTFQKEISVSIDDPIDWDLLGGIAKTNEDARMITIDERTANANKRVEEAQPPKPSVTEHKSAVQDESGSCINRAVGDLLLQKFPEILDLEPRYKEGDSDWSKPLEEMLSKLTDNQRAMEAMKRSVDWPSFGEADV